VKVFLRGVESGSMEPSLNKTSRNLGGGLATNWLRFSRQCDALEATPLPMCSYLARIQKEQWSGLPTSAVTIALLVYGAGQDADSP
jgi:hypothetical protein